MLLSSNTKITTLFSNRCTHLLCSYSLESLIKQGCSYLCTHAYLKSAMVKNVMINKMNKKMMIIIKKTFK